MSNTKGDRQVSRGISLDFGSGLRYPLASNSKGRNHRRNLSETYSNANHQQLSQTLDSPRQVLVRKPSNPGARTRSTEGPRPTFGNSQEEQLEAILSSKDNSCPLANPHFPATGEIDHFVHRCYCYLCSCGGHQCPGYLRANRPMPKAVKSQYQYEYIRKKGKAAQKCIVEQPFLKNSQPIDLLTTHQQDYQPFLITHEGEPQITPSRPLKFTARTSYQSNYHNWGVQGANYNKRPTYPHREDDIQMNLRTTYNDKFSQFLKSKEEADPMYKTMNTTTSIAFGYPSTTREFYGETTHGKEFKEFSRDDCAKMAARPEEDPVKRNSPRKQHFSTTYRSSYLGKQQALRLPRANNLPRGPKVNLSESLG